MRKYIASVFALVCVLGLAGCSQAEDNAHAIQHPYVQEYVAGQGNIKGDVAVEKFTSISEDFAIGANEDGYAVFKAPEKAFDKLLELYSDGIALIQAEFDLEPLSHDAYDLYGVYGWQVTTGTPEETEQAFFVSQFFDIYENSYGDP